MSLISKFGQSFGEPQDISSQMSKSHVAGSDFVSLPPQKSIFELARSLWLEPRRKIDRAA
jgi:hypothetical protein